MTDYERGLRDGRVKTLSSLAATFLKNGMGLSYKFVQDEAAKASKANPQPPRKGGDGGGDG